MMESDVSISSSEDEVDTNRRKKPAASSSDKEERLFARQERIRRRLEYNETQKRRRGESSEAKEEEAETVRPPLASACVEHTRHELYRLEMESQEMISNVRIANENKEVMRRRKEQEERLKRLQLLDEENRQAEEQFHVINSRWSEISNMSDPLNIHNECEIQRQRCDALLKQKNEMITMLKEDLERCDANYREDMTSQNEDVNLLVERIEKQMKLLRRAYWNNLDLIQHAIHFEVNEFMQAKQKLWDKLYKKRNKLEQETLEDKIERQKQYEEQLQELRLKYEDVFRQKKIQLERNIQNQELELEQLKPNCLQLKLAFEYNFTLVQKRVEENMYIHSQQKRKNNKLHEMVSVLRQKAKQIKEKSDREVKKLRDDVAKLQLKIHKIEIISKQLCQENETKYHQLWNLNQKEAETHLQKILQTDQTIYEQFLGIDWEPPTLELFKKEHFFPKRNDTKVDLKRFLDDSKIGTSFEPGNNRRRIYECIKQALLEQADFLTDFNVNNIVKRYGEETETLVKLNDILTTLGVNSIEDMNLLIDKLTPYVYCRTCKDDNLRRDTTFQRRLEDKVSFGTSQDGHERSEIALIHSKRVDNISPFVQKYEDGFLSLGSITSNTTVALPDIRCSSHLSNSSGTTITRHTKTKISRTKSLTDIIARNNLSLVMDTRSVQITDLGETTNDFQLHEDDYNKFDTNIQNDFQIREDDCGKIETHIKYSVQLRDKNDEFRAYDDFHSTNKTSVELISETHGIEKANHTDKFDTWTEVSFKDVKQTPRICSSDSHSLTIQRSNVLETLKTFIQHKNKIGYSEIDSNTNGLSSKSISRPLTISKTDVENYWHQFLKIFPPEKVQLWDSVFKILHKYHDALLRRHKLNDEIACLTARNKHLRQLLGRHIKADEMSGADNLPPIQNGEPFKTMGNSFL